MTRRSRMLPRAGVVSVALVAWTQMAFNCGGSVGDPCIPEDEYRSDFRGFSEAEVNIESRSFQCETRVCLVANFRGRVTCPYGQPADPTDGARAASGLPDEERCRVPGGGDDEEYVTVPVEPGLVDRRPEDAVYCSCRCDGPDPNARYCECPSGFVCAPLAPNVGFGDEQLIGSYCVKEGSVVDDIESLGVGVACDTAAGNCGPARR